MKTGWIVSGALLGTLLLARKNPTLIRSIWALLPHKKVNNAVSDVDPATFDVEAYMGSWRQIYRTQNNFQNDAATSTYAKYTLLDDGVIEVENAEIVDQTITSAKGIAVPERVGDNTKLLVSFFPPFAGSYQILALGPLINNQYSYALVGSPYSNSFWILARDDLGEEVVNKLQQKAVSMGFILDR